MAITKALNTTFAHLSDDRTLSKKQNSASREREAIVDITFDGSQNYVTGGNVIDLSGVRGFTIVYACEILHRSFGRVMSFVPGAGNAASLGKIKIWHTDGNELSSGNTGTQSMTLRVRIRGR